MILRNIHQLSNRHLQWHCRRSLVNSSRLFCRCLSSGVIRIGDVERPVRTGKNPHLVPRGYLSPSPSSDTLQHLQWMLSKDSLGQDMLLIGPPGDVYRRRLALMYAELCQREVHVLDITADLTESDLKQRRELSHTAQDTVQVHFVDQFPVQAALEGRLLILNGLERAERNVLPTLNNLLEHRAMNLEDGRFLVSPELYQQLKQKHHGSFTSDRIVPVHPDFRVLATAVPVPPWRGRGASTLDPPLRSRFQIRRVDRPSSGDLYSTWAEFQGSEQVQQAVQTLAALDAGSDWEFPYDAVPGVLKTLSQFPNEVPETIWERHYPVAKIPAASYETAQKTWRAIWGNQRKSNNKSKKSAPCCKYQVQSIEQSSTNPCRATVEFRPDSLDPAEDTAVRLEIPCGDLPFQGKSPNSLSSNVYVETPVASQVIAALMQEHANGRDLLLVSEPGQGKSALAYEWCRQLGYRVHLVPLFREMTFRDLFLRRTTAGWDETPLIRAARLGHVCVLDGVDKVRPDVLASLQSLCVDREVDLTNGQKMTGRFTEAAANHPDIIPIHPSFRIIALGSTHDNTAKRQAWLSDSVMASFSTLTLATPTQEETRAILHRLYPGFPTNQLESLLRLRDELTSEMAAELGVTPLSLRNLIRIVRSAPNNNTDGQHHLYSALYSLWMASLLPPMQRVSLDSLLSQCGIRAANNKANIAKDMTIAFDDNQISIGKFTMPRRKNLIRPERVPSPHFFDIPNHVQTIRDILSDWVYGGERSFLLIGNQGVGKNVLVDRLCQVANFEREYIQLHRDSTIGQITLQPSVENGQVVWHDSPLIRAVSEGLVLIVDEADKAPTEVLAVLKGLVEDGELLLADGRRISRHESTPSPDIIPIHPDFTLFVLANRPGFPFLGNAFFKEIGDCFAIRVVANPDFDSEIKLLESYGPDVDPRLIRSIAGSFADLRALADSGDLSYPYSTREAVAVVKHLQKFPQDGIVASLHNVLDWDSYDEAVYSTLGKVFSRHGIAVELYPQWREAMAKRGQNLKIEFLEKDGSTSMNGSSPSPPPLSSPKEGKWDENNDPHIGGNQWAGGTGGSDTAGLGGRGGPYRLDRGHRVHQVSDEDKAKVSAEAARAAREMAQKALSEKLKEIRMSTDEWDMYQSFVSKIKNDVSNLRSILSQADLRQSERGWIKQQSHGELDDSKLVDSITGERFVYKRRGTVENSVALSQRPKRFHFLVDCSASMYRFNGYDQRLIRCLEAANLIMESFAGFEDRFEYSIVGHSGDSACIPLVDFQSPPRNEKERMKVLQTMIAHTQYCESGDHTLEAVEQAIHSAAVSPNGSDDGDNMNEVSIVIAISDANLERYGIHPRQLGKIISSGNDAKVRCYVVFIASFGREAEEIKEALPLGRGLICSQTSDLPKIVREVLTQQV